MRLTAFTDFALRLLIHVAQHPGRLCTIAEVAERYGVSEAHLMKVTHLLAQGGFLETVRGKGGGMRLARPPQRISIGEVVRRTETDFALVECFASGSQCTLSGHCRLADLLDRALGDFLARLDRQTLADVLPGGPAAATIAPPRTRRRGPAPGARP